MAYEVLLIGLGQVGASIGLALANAEGELVRIGYDPDKKAGKQAKAAGAVDRLVPHLRQAVVSADLIIFALPHHEVEDYLQHLGAKMKSEAIIIDTAPIKAPFFEWAASYLSANRNVIGATPIIGALDAEIMDPGAAADRYEGGMLAITAPPGTAERALAVAINLAKILEAAPFFLDIDEHDAAFAATDDLPVLLSAALFQATAKSSSWRELRRVAGTTFTHATDPYDSDPKLLQRRFAANREKIIARLDLVTNEISHMRDLLANLKDDELLAYFEQAFSARLAWLRARARGDWASAEFQTQPSIDSTGVLGQLFGLSKRKPKPD
jgi:prephenate dehydrogenase